MSYHPRDVPFLRDNDACYLSEINFIRRVNVIKPRRYALRLIDFGGQKVG